MRAIGLCWRASPLFCIASIMLALISGAVPVAFTIVTGRVVGAISEAIGSDAGSAARARAVQALVILVAIYVLRPLVFALEGPVTASLGSRFTLELRREVLGATLGPVGIAHLENPSTADELQLIGSHDSRYHAENLVHNIASVGSEKITGLGSAVVLAAFAWWAPLLVLPALFLAYRWVHRDIDTHATAQWGGTPELRRSDYLRDLAVRPEAAKEIRVFGLASFIVSWFASSWTEAMRPQWRVRRRNGSSIAQAALAQLVVGLVIFGLLARAALRGEISLASFVVFAGALHGMQNLGPDMDSEWAVLRGVRVVDSLVRLRSLTDAPNATRAATIERSGPIVFEDVTFAYPGGAGPVLDRLRLEIPQGRSLAIVGLNGAGKTTLVKLLARLYEPESGRITSGGVDIAGVAPEVWRRRIGVIFQDFVRFELDARANVGFGALELLHRDDALDRAVGKANAAAIIAALPESWNTVLSRGYDGGVELSGGQWQRIALARAFMALEGGADILVLDEPTANLDVRAEAELFDRFLEITEGTTTILISHRFSTVRRADRIAVLDAGRVAEHGTHDELTALDGRYARLFALQAERFVSHHQESADA